MGMESPPREPGYYWARVRTTDPASIIEVRQDPYNPNGLVFTDGNHSVPVSAAREWLSGPIPEPGSGEPTPPADSRDKTPFTVNDRTQLNNLCHAVRNIRGRIKGLEAEPDSLHNRITENVGILVGRIDKVQVEVESLRYAVASHTGHDHPTSRQIDELRQRVEKVERSQQAWRGWQKTVGDTLDRLIRMENIRPQATPSREDLEIEVDSALEVIAREIESGEWAGSHPAESVRKFDAKLVRSIRDRLVEELSQ